MEEYKQALRELTKASNGVLFQIVEETARVFSDNIPSRWTKELLDVECERFLNRLLDMRNGFMLRHQDRLLLALGREAILEDACA
jgi:hypothetical protein